VQQLRAFVRNQASLLLQFRKLGYCIFYSFPRSAKVTLWHSLESELGYVLLGDSQARKRGFYKQLHPMQQNKRILGLDISKSSVTACLLESKPNDPRQFYYECPFMLFSANSEGIKALLALKPDIAIMEPTGVNYSRL
jgi:hypothetical protein